MSDDIRAILPTPTNDSVEFWRGCNDGKLLLRHCRDCGKVHYYPRMMCPHCASRDLDWVEASGRGTVFSFSHVHVSFYGPEWQSQLPYVVVLVDLAEGPRMVSRLIGADRETVSVGAAVALRMVTVQGQGLPYFVLQQGE
jgi:uncharacterized OB-fold protein